MMKFNSQKATGIHWLTNTNRRDFNSPTANIYPKQRFYLTFPTFARPCPTIPRHGFVDSRIVHNQHEFGMLMREIHATGEPVEIVCMPFIRADYSGILTPQGVTFGKGHDGATNGTSAKFIPCNASVSALEDRLNFSSEIVGITSPDVVYAEFVGLLSESRPTIVQLRGGPQVSGTTGYIPHDLTVEHVVCVEGDLLKWEQTVKTFRPNTVVHHPYGALSSHYAVHCILHGIPIVCTRVAPTVGDVLQAENTTPPLTSEDYTTISQYLAASISTPLKRETGNSDSKLRVAIATLHASPLWGNEDHLLLLRALGAAITFRYAAAACFGELRHFKCHGPGGSLETPITWDECGTVSREFVFYQIYKHNIRAVIEVFPCVVRDYQRTGWSGAFGGKKWAACSEAVLRLGLGIQQFLHKKNKKAWNELMIGWNATVNAVHNGGGLLTKHCDANFLDTMARTPYVGFLNPYCAKMVLGLEPSRRHKKPGKVLPLHSRKAAIQLYPFRNSVDQFKVVVRSKRYLTGTYTAKVEGGFFEDFRVILPFVTTTSDVRRPVALCSYMKELKFALHTKEPVSVQVKNGCVVKVWVGRAVYNGNRV